MEHRMMLDYLKNRFDFKTYFEDEEYVFMERKGKKVDIYKPQCLLVVNYNLAWVKTLKDIDLVVKPLIQ